MSNYYANEFDEYVDGFQSIDEAYVDDEFYDEFSLVDEFYDEAAEDFESEERRRFSPARNRLVNSRNKKPSKTAMVLQTQMRKLHRDIAAMKSYLRKNPKGRGLAKNVADLQDKLKKMEQEQQLFRLLGIPKIKSISIGDNKEEPVNSVSYDQVLPLLLSMNTGKKSGSGIADNPLLLFSLINQNGGGFNLQDPLMLLLLSGLFKS